MKNTIIFNNFGMRIKDMKDNYLVNKCFKDESITTDYYKCSECLYFAKGVNSSCTTCPDRVLCNYKGE